MPHPLESPHRRFIEAPLPMDAVVERPANASQVIVLLHGYTQSGALMAKKLRSALPADAAVFAPNAPFPVIDRKERTVRIGFSWYFYDGRSDEYLVPPDTAIRFVQGGLEAHGLSLLPVTWIGYSQGGYLSLFCAARNPRTVEVVGLACEFLPDEVPGPIPFPVHGIHGAGDEIVSEASAREAHERLTARGVKGTFTSLPGSGHRIDEPMLAERARLLKKP